MATPILTLGLQNFRNQINAAFPKRDKTSDGWIGDTAHQAETSGHNPDDTPGSKPEWDGDPDSIPEVRAVDVDANLNDSAVTTQQLIDWLCRLPNIGSVFRYMIYNRKMYHVNNGFAPVDYTGASPHTEHFHVSGTRTQAADNNTTFDFQLEELTMPTAEEIAKAVWEYDVDPTAGTQTAYGAVFTSLLRDGAQSNKQLPEINAATVRLEAAIAAVPSADENADAVMARLDSIPLTELATVLHDVLGPERTAELKGIL